MILHKETFLKYNFEAHIKKGNTLKYCCMKCDFCGSKYERQLYLVLRGRKHIQLDSCGNKNCTKEKTKKANLVRYGVESHNSLLSVKEKKKNTIRTKYGVDNPSQSVEIQNKIKNTNMKRYGVEHPHQSLKVREKFESTMMDKYGVRCALQLPKFASKVKEAFFQKKDQIVQKRNKTMLDRYGKENASQVKEFTEKRKQTNLKRYKTTDPLNANRTVSNRIPFSQIIERCKNKNYIPQFNEEEYKNNRQIFSFLCEKHNIKFNSNIFYISNINTNQCPKCRNYTFSRHENEISYLLSSLNVEFIQHDRSQIKGEIDLYIPNCNLAIEFNGLYWHCELNKHKKYHLNKFNMCKDKNIQLLQIYEDEWKNKSDIWKSILKSNLGVIENKLNAREFFINKFPNNNEVKKFLIKNHLQGYCRYKKAFTLEDKDNNIVYCITLRKPFTKKHNSIEIARVSTKLDSVVRGAFSRLLKYAKQWAKEQRYKKIITYSDCRYSCGNIYQKNGFEFVKHTTIGYDYTDFINRFNRFKFRAKNGKSELEVAKENNVVRIYNAGNYLWQLQI